MRGPALGMQRADGMRCAFYPVLYQFAAQCRARICEGLGHETQH
jgi:hypothetical protein